LCRYSNVEWKRQKQNTKNEKAIKKMVRVHDVIKSRGPKLGIAIVLRWRNFERIDQRVRFFHRARLRKCTGMSRRRRSHQCGRSRGGGMYWDILYSSIHYRTLATVGRQNRVWGGTGHEYIATLCMPVHWIRGDGVLRRDRCHTLG